ncbi:Alginate lyase [Granulicella rosea]|uniref:Alginate lyase n=1 Tax=Granulicella rosea TaxID=474952 RepID=A0A239HN68_9BACT|nr:alginate lyase family protein [Granulicella rosea]SNS82518.1 Alginate lyase [Granulicella rosea]
MRPSRRNFCRISASALLLGARGLRAQADLAAQGSARVDVAAFDHDRILAAANRALEHPPASLPALPVSPAGPHDFYSLAEPDGEQIASPHRDALLRLTLDVPALAAAAHLSQPAEAARYAQHAARLLEAWLVAPATRITPSFAFAQYLPPEKTGHQGGNPEGILEAVGLAEVAVAIPFLQLSPEQADPIKRWFAEYLEWLTTSRLALLARDKKDRHGSSWLLQTAAIARLTQNDAILADCRHRFKTVTIRAQIEATGVFPHELTTANPLRNSLTNLDLIAGVCVLLTTRFDSPWNYELQDGPGARAAVAKFYPYIESRNLWPYKADLDHFADLPGRRPALLFAARAYSRPEYAALWKKLDPNPSVPAILRSMPIHQPVLWTTQPTPLLD